MDHYYSENPKVDHNIGNINYQINDINFTFTTDAGVFSKGKVDYGTHILLKSLPHLGGEILDLGCGYGPIGIVLARLNQKSKVTMVDINQRAVSLASKNIRQNHIENACAFSSQGFENIDTKFDYILSNPPIRTGKRIIYNIFEDSISYLKDGGGIYLVIQKKQGAKSAMEKLTEIYGNCQTINKKGGYWVLFSSKK